MANIRSNIIQGIENTSDSEVKKGLVDALWNHAREKGTPLITQVDGKYKAIFLFQSGQSGLNITLESADLYDRMIKDSKHNTAGLPEKFKYIPGTDVYYLEIDDLPIDACAQYTIKISETSNTKRVADPYNKHQISKQCLDLSTSPSGTANDTKKGEIKEQKTDESASHSVAMPKVSHMLMPKAVLPISSKLQTSADIKVTQEVYHSKKFTMFQDRSVYTYKSDNFDPSTGKVIFMLDGKDFCESIVPGLSVMTKDKQNSLSNTAIVFIDSDPKPISQKYPERVHEFYYEKSDFSKMLAEEIIPHYSKQLGVENHPEQLILAGHSLAAYPVIDVATNHTSVIGGVILISPAINQNKLSGFTDNPDDKLKSLPIYMQIGQLEDAKPPEIDQKPKDMTNESRLEATRKFHDYLCKKDYNVAKILPVHQYGHANIHALQGLQDGMKYIHEHALTLNDKKSLRLK